MDGSVQRGQSILTHRFCRITVDFKYLFPGVHDHPPIGPLFHRLRKTFGDRIWHKRTYTDVTDANEPLAQKGNIQVG
ncbi:hypothetical protein V473_17760 [Sphingobium cupriresistens LL01]|uniref:Uncharacterized protein n=1 Tax=Sphingobium cupriresistens LL01 TaxID=1420583 RepID=A0A0J7XRA6_9SPHN|nr:hypothetical protein V473_17760 [Sphingobium cupriresistens LL01]